MGSEINFDDILLHFVATQKHLKSIDDIDASIYNEWNDTATVEAEAELQRINDLKTLNQKRKIEEEQRKKEEKAMIAEREKYQNQFYDGRVWNDETAEYEGHILTAGDRIRYWPPQTIANHQEMITTKITFIGDLYYTKVMAGNVPISVEQSGNPPFWDTEIEKLPLNPDNPKLFKLKYCQLIPSEDDDELFIQQKKSRQEFEEKIQKMGFGGALYQKKKKKKRSKINNDSTTNNKEILSSGTDSDIQILDNHKIKKKKRQSVRIPDILNEEESVTFPLHKSKKNKKRKKSMNKEEKNMAEPVKKKRRLNNPKNDNRILIESEEEPNDIDIDQKHMFEPKKSPKQKRKRSRMESMESVIPFPPTNKQSKASPTSSPKRKKQKKSNNSKREDSPLSDISNTPPKQQKSKRMLRPKKRKLLPTKPSNDISPKLKKKQKSKQRKLDGFFEKFNNKKKKKVIIKQVGNVNQQKTSKLPTAKRKNGKRNDPMSKQLDKT